MTDEYPKFKVAAGAGLSASFWRIFPGPFKPFIMGNR
jgi:hypothetical protein